MLPRASRAAWLGGAVVSVVRRSARAREASRAGERPEMIARLTCCEQPPHRATAPVADGVQLSV